MVSLSGASTPNNSTSYSLEACVIVAQLLFRGSVVQKKPFAGTLCEPRFELSCSISPPQKIEHHNV